MTRVGFASGCSVATSGIVLIGTTGEPLLVPADQISGPVKPEVLEDRRCEAGGVPLVADEDDALVVTADGIDAVRARRIESPLEHVAVDHDRTREFTVALALVDRADVDDERSCFAFRVELLHLDAQKTRPRISQKSVDAATLHVPPRSLTE